MPKKPYFISLYVLSILKSVFPYNGIDSINDFQSGMTRAAQTVCLGGSRKKRSEKKGDFHCLTFFTAPTLTLGD
ncbi:MAG: hypothetical protein IJV86_02575, partial [Clostridia bacterium]|nr:hypothetical protein [Clostridia bacterium]